MRADPKLRYGIAALQRGLRLLALVGGAAEPLTASEIAHRSALHSSTVHRYLVNLEAAGFLTYDGESNGYQLGPCCVTLGRAALDRLDVRRVSLPILQELNRRTRETVHLTVRHQAAAVYVEKLDSLEPLRIFSQVGATVPLHCSGVGKVLLAYAEPEEQERLLRQLDLTRRTPNTIVSLQQLQAELGRVERQGYAVDFEENEAHIRCIAAPIWNHNGLMNAAFSITGPAARMSKARLAQLVPVVKEASRSISERLGYEPPARRALAR